MKKAIQEIRKFNKEREWEVFHTPENLAKSISIEAGELLECFQWNNDYNKQNVCEELADVINYCILMADALDVDLEEIGMTEFTTLLNGEDAEIIYLARPGCTYCQKQEPIVKQIIAEHDVVFHYLNTDNLTQDQFNTIIDLDEDESLFGEDGKNFGTPTVLIVKEGKIVDAQVGYTEKAQFEKFLQNNGFIS